MLTRLNIKNFAIVKHLELNMASGFTAITGETGAGKSIALDAISLCLGERADANAVRVGAQKADITAQFTLEKHPRAQHWLEQHDMLDDDEPHVCFVRRVISAEGRSKAYINGHPVSLQQLKQFGVHIVRLQGQHSHLQLLKDDVQRSTLDSFGKHAALVAEVNEYYRQWRTLQTEMKALQGQAQQRLDRQQLLRYQVAELNEFSLQVNEFQELELEHKRLSHGQTLLEQAQTSFYYLYDNDEMNALSVIQQSLERLVALEEHDPSLSPIISMLNEASIQVEEASRELRHYCEHLEIDPLRLQQVEARYSRALELARKHAVLPEQLADYHAGLVQELASLDHDEHQLDNIQARLTEKQEAYFQAARQLSQARTHAAAALSSELETLVRQMNLPHARIAVAVSFDGDKAPTANGLDDIQFRVSTNPGQPLDCLDKVVSGGELSRIGLAVQVLVNEQENAPTLIFDEVDTGISGPTASIVGALLRQLGDKQQVVCVTHLPQVAARAHHQLFVAKHTDGETTETQMVVLSELDRVNELARLLAGDRVTEYALANARELLGVSLAA